MVAISIHALREESDYKMGANKQTTTFQSTLSVRRATVVAFDAAEDVVISIHALREESDARHVFRRAILRYFNPRSP